MSLAKLRVRRLLSKRCVFTLSAMEMDVLLLRLLGFLSLSADNKSLSLVGIHTHIFIWEQEQKSQLISFENAF